MSGWAEIESPRSFWSQITLTTPGGRISAQISPSRQVVSGVGRRRLQDHGVAGQQARAELDRQQDQREVPRRDRGHDAERRVLLDDLGFGVVLEDLFRQVEGREVAQAAGGAADFPHRHRQGLALFGGQKAAELFGPCFKGVGHLVDIAGAFLDRQRRPRREGGLGGRPRPGRAGPCRPWGRRRRLPRSDGFTTSNDDAPGTSLPLISNLKSFILGS